MDNKTWALRYYDAGWQVLPCRNKIPLLKTYKHFENLRIPRESVEAWWTELPNAQIALLCGRISGVTVVDFDWPKDEQLNKIYDEERSPKLLADRLPVTLSSFSGSGGIHKFFKYADIQNSNGIIHPQVDVKTQGGYIILPPSRYDEERSYAWDELFPWTEENLKTLATLPPQFINMAKKKQIKESIYKWDNVWDGVRGGKRDSTGTQIAGLLHQMTVNDKLPEPIAREFLHFWNKKNKPPMEDQQVDKIFNSIYKKPFYANLR